jgi:hypothetical protein
MTLSRKTPQRRISARRLIAGGLVALTALLPAQGFAQACLQPSEKTAFDVRALQSQLMVVAIACGHQDEYNRFVTGNQSDLLAAYRSVEAHFRRTGGGRRATDSFITDLANRQSQVGITQGTAFCRNQGPLFQQVSSIRGQQALAQFAAQREIPNQYQPPLCGSGSARDANTQRANR